MVILKFAKVQKIKYDDVLCTSGTPSMQDYSRCKHFYHHLLQILDNSIAEFVKSTNQPPNKKTLWPLVHKRTITTNRMPQPAE
jgi:hypothetical protein